MSGTSCYLSISEGFFAASLNIVQTPAADKNQMLGLYMRGIRLVSQFEKIYSSSDAESRLQISNHYNIVRIEL